MPGLYGSGRRMRDLSLADARATRGWDRSGSAESTARLLRRDYRSHDRPRRCVRRVGEICVRRSGSSVTRRCLRRDVCTATHHERGFAGACELHDHGSRTARMGVLRLLAGRGTQVQRRQEGALCVAGGLMDSEHGQTRTAHQRHVGRELRRLASRCKDSWRSLLCWPGCPRGRNGSDRSPGRQAPSPASSRAADRSWALATADVAAPAGSLKLAEVAPSAGA
jgi:hypothetical protein